MEELKNVVVEKMPIAASFNWSVGKYMDRYIKELKNKRLFGVKCPNCGCVYLPPRMMCERCFTKIEEWVEVSDEGTVESFTIAQVKLDREEGGLKELEEPEIIGLIKHDGTDSCLVHRLGEVKPEDVKIGMKVRAVWTDEPNGELGDLKYYKPI
jgi:hypothetical protein